MNNEKKSRIQINVSLVILVISSIYALLMLISRHNFLTIIAVALAIGISVFILLKYLIKKKLEFIDILSYTVLMGSVILFYILFGADAFRRRVSYNLIWTLLPISIAYLAYILNNNNKSKHKRLITIIPMILTVLTTTFYMLIMDLRAKPTVFSIMKGHDDYLYELKNSITIKPDNPNVLIILMDDMAYSDLSCYSYLGQTEATIKTPVIDALAEDGVLFENFYACAPVCSPSRFGLLTGRYASRGYLDNVVFPTVASLKPFAETRMFNPFLFSKNVDGLLGDEITFAEVMQQVGYNTGMFGKWNLGDYGEYLPTNQGFDYFFGSYYVNDMTPYNIVREKNGTAKEVYSHYDMLDQSETTKILTSEIKDYVEKSIDNNEKFLAYYATPWPHFPIFSGVKGDTTDDNYIDCIEEFDTYLGDIIALLKDKGIYDDTLIMFTSDNGPGREGVTGALRGRKGTTFDGGQKVPFIATYPNAGVGKGAVFSDTNVIKSPTMNIDIFPTLLDFIGVNILPQDRVIDGISMYDLMLGNIANDKNIHEVLFHIHGGKVQGIQMPKEVDGNVYDFKYYDSVWTENTAFFNQIYKNYLFNLTRDPAEGYNLSMKYPQIAQDLSEELKKFRKVLKENRRGIIDEYYK